MARPVGADRVRAGGGAQHGVWTWVLPLMERRIARLRDQQVWLVSEGWMRSLVRQRSILPFRMRS